MQQARDQIASSRVAVELMYVPAKRQGCSKLLISDCIKSPVKPGNCCAEDRARVL